MKLVMKTLATLSVSLALVGCGAFPSKPKEKTVEDQKDTSVAPSKRVAHLVTEMNLTGKKIAVLDVKGNPVAMDAGCKPTAPAPLADAADEKFTMIRDQSDFGQRGIHLVSTLSPEIQTVPPAETRQFTLVVDCDTTAPMKSQLTTVKITFGDQTEKDAAGKTFLGYGVAQVMFGP
jgi:hypothetical protein